MRPEKNSSFIGSASGKPDEAQIQIGVMTQAEVAEKAAAENARRLPDWGWYMTDDNRAAEIHAAASDLLEAARLASAAYSKFQELAIRGSEVGKLIRKEFPDEYATYIEHLVGPCHNADLKLRAAIKRAEELEL